MLYYVLETKQFFMVTEDKAMASIILNDVQINELPKKWIKKINPTNNNETYIVKIQSKSEHERSKEDLKEIIREMRNQAEENNIQPKDLEEILGTEIKHIL